MAQDPKVDELRGAGLCSFSAGGRIHPHRTPPPSNLSARPPLGRQLLSCQAASAMADAATESQLPRNLSCSPGASAMTALSPNVHFVAECSSFCTAPVMYHGLPPKNSSQVTLLLLGGRLKGCRATTLAGPGVVPAHTLLLPPCFACLLAFGQTMLVSTCFFANEPILLPASL